MKRSFLLSTILFLAFLFLFNSKINSAEIKPETGNKLNINAQSMLGERIFFLRKYDVSGLKLGDIYSMKPDGTDVRRFSNFSDNYFVTEQPKLSKDGRMLSFISNYESWKSAFYTDAFLVDLATGFSKRITGFEKTSPATSFGTVNVQVEDPKKWAISPSAIRVSYRGCSNFVTGNAVVLTVPANEDIWVKAELAKAKGDLKVVNVPAGQNVDLKLNLQAGSLSAESCSPSIDNNFLAVSTNNENVNFPFYTVGIYRVNDGALVSEIGGAHLGGDIFPAYSPDGSLIAYCNGQHTLNNLAIIPTANLSGTPTELVYGSGFGIQAFCAQPAWSPDGQEIAFVYTTLQTSFLGTELQSNIYKVSVNGGTPVQLTSFSGNVVASNPSFSPDGKNISFTHLTSSNPVFLLTDLINQTYNSDVFVVSESPGAFGKMGIPTPLTHDGNSLDPSWGVVNVTVGIAENENIVKSFELLQNYPNPFNSETSISFILPKQTHTRLSIFNILGEEIYKLADEILPSGSHQFIWKGTDLFKNPLPTGIYVYKLQTDSFVAVKKMLLVR